MRRYGDYDLTTLQREAEKLRAQAIRKAVVTLARKIACLFGGNRLPGGRPAGA
jgi:hypothetical protein